MLYGNLNVDGEVIDLVEETVFRKRFPDTTFPEVLTEDMIAPFGYVPIESTVAPEGMVQSINQRYAFNIINNDGVYTREVYLEELTADASVERAERKNSEVRAKRDQLLKDSDYTQSEDFTDLKVEWKAYRQVLRDLPNQGIDPFQVEFPLAPSVDGTTDDLDERKAFMVNTVNSEYLRVSSAPVADTGLGYEVNAGYEDFLNFDIALSLGVTEVEDVNDVQHTVTPEDLQTIIDSIKLSGLQMIGTKRASIQAINAATTIAELEAL